MAEGALKGNRATVDFTWRHLHGKTCTISWQEADGSTVVHIDDFEAGRSLCFFTTPNAEFFRLEGALARGALTKAGPSFRLTDCCVRHHCVSPRTFPA
ncbi:MoaF-related domain-containing protein [Paraburkholderia silvatlantica]|uniref:MoaF-related domain-containing protein n=1 Tax=Paraburkholderia silvatlantica TaxID=321895 RepID=UPI0035D4C4B7